MTPMLSFENVNVAIADAPVLRNVSFSLQPGVSAALIASYLATRCLKSSMTRCSSAVRGVASGASMGFCAHAGAAETVMTVAARMSWVNLAMALL